MKYELKRTKKEKIFQPFSITLTFENMAEYVHFHDVVMPRISPLISSHPMYGEIYEMAHGDIHNAQGEIEIKK